MQSRIMLKCTVDENLFEVSYYSLGCELKWRERKERGRGKKKPVVMGKDFDFQIPSIYVLFKLTIWLKAGTE